MNFSILLYYSHHKAVNFCGASFSSNEYPLYKAMVQMVNNLPEMWETQVQSQGQENPLEKGIMTHSIILTWRIPWTKEPGGLNSMNSQRVRYD